MVKRIAVLGPQGVGKSCLIAKYIKKNFFESYLTTMYNEKYIDMYNNIIWDTPGSLRYQEDALEKISKMSKGYIICFEPSVDTSFHEALTLIDSLKIKNKPVIMAATKSDILPFDIKRVWSSEAHVRGWKIIGTSCANNNGITRVFDEIFKLVDEEDEIELGTIQAMSSWLWWWVHNYIYSFE